MCHAPLSCLSRDRFCYADMVLHNSSSMLLSIFGGSIPDLRALLLEERFLDGWVPFTASRYGVTLAAFNVTAMKVWIRMRKVAPAKKVV